MGNGKKRCLVMGMNRQRHQQQLQHSPCLFYDIRESFKKQIANLITDKRHDAGKVINLLNIITDITAF